MDRPEESNTSRRPRGVIPCNPGLQELVDGKRQWQDSPDAPKVSSEFRLWNQRGYLPHRDAPGLRQFVTFRLADSFPVELRSEWGALLKTENSRRRQQQIEEYLNKGRGQCYLKHAELAELVERALRCFRGTRYELQAWVVMPNHVHVLFTQKAEPLRKVLHSWKSYTANEANRIPGRTGQFWDEDYWDTFMRDEHQATRSRRYIENNPVKARLVREAVQWPWSSARFRDEYARLKLPA